LEKDPEALSDAALLAILLRTGRQGQNAIALARETISRFGGLNGLMMTTQEDLLSVKEIRKAKILISYQATLQETTNALNTAFNDLSKD